VAITERLNLLRKVGKLSKEIRIALRIVGQIEVTMLALGPFDVNNLSEFPSLVLDLASHLAPGLTQSLGFSNFPSLG
jgi:hypothetical protein